jgi:hypothetical protein
MKGSKPTFGAVHHKQEEARATEVETPCPMDTLPPFSSPFFRVFLVPISPRS